MNFYHANIGLGRYDGLAIYAGASFSPKTLIYRVEAKSNAIPNFLGGKTPIIGLHLRATPADGEYGFLAEITAFPSGPISSNYFFIRFFCGINCRKKFILIVY